MPERTEGEEDYGHALAILRIVRGWTQGELGAAVGLDHSTVSGYERERLVPLALVRQMVAAMGFPAYLLDRSLAHLRWARMVRQLLLFPPADPAAGSIGVMAGAAGLAREELARNALAGVLEVPLVDSDDPATGAPKGSEPPSATPGGRRRGSRRAGGPRPAGADLGRTLRILRLIAQLERQDLATAVGVSTEVIESYERDRTAPLAPTLQRLLDAMGACAEVYDRTVRFLAGARASLRWYSAAGAASERAQIESFAAAEADRAVDETRGWVGRLQAASRLFDSRRRAQALWERLAAFAPEVRETLVREGAELWESGFCELLCDRSRQAASDSADVALHLAQLAVLIAQRVPGSHGWRSRLEGYAQAHLANALRVAGRLPAAVEAFARAKELWQAGAADDPRLLNEARMLHLEASLLRCQRHLREAVALLDRALAIDRWGETPSLLIGKSKAIEELGDYHASIALLRQAAAQIDADRESLNLFLVHLNLATNLCHLGRHAEAKLALPAIRALAQRLDNQLGTLRVGWLAARIAAGLGRTAEAVASYERVRAGFEERDIAYDAALVTVELAALHSTQGRTADVRHLVRRSVPIFRRQGVHAEARRALEIFRLAVEADRSSVEFVRSVLAYLIRARNNPRLRYRHAT